MITGQSGNEEFGRIICAEIDRLHERARKAEALLAEYADPDWTKNPETARSRRNAEDAWALGELAEQVQPLLAALHRVIVGGNHLATYKTNRWPDPETDPQDALRILCATQEFDMWCCWREIMLARAVLARRIEAPSGGETPLRLDTLRERDGSADAP